MKFKKQIVIICLFTFLFLPFQVNKSEVETSADLLAIPIAIGIKEIITALLVSSGIVITGQGVHHALVNKVYYDNKDLYDSLTEKAQNSFGSTISLKPYINTVTDTISKVYNLTYNDDYIKDIDMPVIKSEFASGLYTPSSAYTFAFTPASTGVLTVNQKKYTITQSLVDSNASIYFQNTGTHTQVNIWWPSKEYFTPWQTVTSSLAPLNWTFNSACSIPLGVDWETYREKNKGLDIGSTLGAYSNGSICADNVLDWNSEWDVTQENDYPITKVPSIVLDKDYVNDKPIIKEDETPVTGDGLWDTLFGWLKTLLSPITKLLSSLWDLIKSLFDMLKGLLSSILDLLKSLVKSLVDAIAALFVPTVALEDVFNLNQNTFFGQIGEVFNFDKLWNLTPKPYEFEVDFPFYDFAEEEQRPFHLEIKFFENKFMKENINLIRNIITYPLLLISIYFVIMHFLPKRDMD